MKYSHFWKKSFASSKHLMKKIIVVFCCLSIASVLAACGSAQAVSQSTTLKTAPTVNTTSTLTPTPKPKPTPKPTLAPAPKPTPTPQPTEAPAPTQSAPPILDLRPSSMSFVGHLDCQGSTEYVCTAEVIAGATNQVNLHWTAFTNVPGQIVFSPASGVLAPGASVFVRIMIPLNACSNGLFYFQGPANTHTITWAC